MSRNSDAEAHDHLSHSPEADKECADGVDSDVDFESKILIRFQKWVHAAKKCFIFRLNLHHQDGSVKPDNDDTIYLENLHERSGDKERLKCNLPVAFDRSKSLNGRGNEKQKDESV